MALNTRRMSGMAAQPGGHALLETLDAFRRKHASQNKEIIHRNSDLMRANTDLSNKLRESQNELVALRGDYAQLLAATSHLEAKNTGLREQLHAAHEEIRRRDGQSTGGGGTAADVRMQDERFQALRITLDKVVAQLQGAQAICLLTASDNQNTAKFYSPASPPDSPPFALLGTSFASTKPASSASSTTSHKIERRASAQVVVSAQPDLSYISEGSQEPSLSLSQQDYKPYSSSDDEEEQAEFDNDNQRFAFSIPEGHNEDQDQYARYADQQQRNIPFLHHLRQDILAVSSASSVEPDHVGQEIEQKLLSASPKRPPPSHPFSLGSMAPNDLASSTSTSATASPTPTPTMPSFPMMPGSFLQPNPTPFADAHMSSQPSTTDSSSSSASTEKRSRRARPSLVDQMGVSPSHLDISSFGQQQQHQDTSAAQTSGGRRRSERSREVSPLPSVGGQSSEDEDSDSPHVVSSSCNSQRKTPSSSDPDGLYLSKTVRHSTSATTLREKAKAAAASSATNGITPVDASPANRVIARRRSNPTLKTSAGLADAPKPPVLTFNNVKTDRRKTSTAATDARPKTGQKLVNAMQPRPSSVPLVSLDGKSTGSGASSSVKPASVTITRPRSNSAVHRKLPSVSPTNTKNIVQIDIDNSPASMPVSSCSESPATAISSNVTGRAKTRPTRSRSSSPEVDMNSCNTTAVLGDLTLAALPQPSASKASSSSPSKNKEKGKAKEVSPSAAKRPIRRERENSPLTSLSQEQSGQNDESVESMSAASIAGREGRRARANVSYQEPSLNKKMRQPAGYVASIKTTASKHSGPTLGVRRKSSLALGDHSGRKSTSPAPPTFEEDEGRGGQFEDFNGDDTGAGDGGEVNV